MLHARRRARPAAPMPAAQSPGLPVVVVAAVAVLLGVALGVAVVATSPLVVLAGLLGLALALAMAQSTLVGLIAFVAVASLLPYAVVPVRLGFQLTAVDLLLSGLLLVWGLRLLRRRAVLVTAVEGVLLLGFMALAVAAFVMGLTYGISPQTARLFLKLLNSMLFFWTVLNCVRDRRELEWVVRALLIGGGLAATIALVLHALPPELQLRVLNALRVVGYPEGDVLRPIASTDTLRAIGTSVDPNVLGGLLVLAGSLTLAQLFSRAPLLPRRWLALSCGLIVLAMAFSYSRSSWVGLMAGFTFLVSFRYRRAALLGLAAMVALLLLPQGEVFIERFSSGVEARDQAAAMRLGEYKDALRLILRYPWFGVGFGNAPSTDLYVAVSSIYLLILEQTGLVGLVGFLAVVGSLLVRAVAALRRTRREDDEGLYGILIGLLAALVGALTTGLFDHYFMNLVFPHMVALFWGYAGLAVVAARLAAQARGAASEPAG